MGYDSERRGSGRYFPWAWGNKQMTRCVARMLWIAPLVCLLLTGCAALGGQIERLFPGPTPLPSDLTSSKPTATPTAAISPAPLAPTWTPLPTATVFAIGALEATPDAAPVVPTVMPVASACAMLWDLYPQGEQLISEWLAWQTQDPPSLEVYNEQLDEWLERWSEHQERLEQVPPAPEALLLVETYQASADRWVRGFECASNALTTLNPACSGQGLALQQEARDLWYRAYDQLIVLCNECASERPTPTATPTATLSP